MNKPTSCLHLMTTLLLASGLCMAQNPFRSLGVKESEAPVLTLSNGRYPEVIENDTLIRIGSVLLHGPSGTIAGFIQTDTLYSESRMEPEIISKWLSPDPLAHKYAPINPYAFCLNNPLIFRDMDGREVIGLDGKPVNYTRNSDGSIEWSANVTDDIKRIGGAMLKTKHGEEAFNKWQDMPTEVRLVFNDTKSPKGYHGVTRPGLFRLKDEDGYYERVKVIIYSKTLEGDNNRFSKRVDMDEAIGAVSTHESWHADPVQIKLDHNHPAELSQDPGENLPLNSEVTFREQYKANHGDNSSEWKNPYNRKGYYGLGDDNRPRTTGSPGSDQGPVIDLKPTERGMEW